VTALKSHGSFFGGLAHRWFGLNGLLMHRCWSWRRNTNTSSWIQGADGSGKDILPILTGDNEMAITHQAIDKNLHLAKLNGKEVFIFAMR